MDEPGTHYTSQVMQEVKHPPADAGDIRDSGSVPRLGRSPEGGHKTHSTIFTWRILRTEEPGGL